MRKNRTSGSVRGALGNRRSYRERLAVRSEGGTMTEKKSAYLGFEEIKN